MAIPADLGFLRKAPARMRLVNLRNPDDEMEAQFNPTEFEESVVVNYNRLKVLGLSHEPLQYQNTGNHGFEVELAFRVYDDNGAGVQSNRLFDIADKRRLLLSYCYSSRNPGDIVGGAPPRILFVWPKIASLVAVITKVSFHHTLFAQQGHDMHFSAKLSLEEIRDFRLFSDVVRASGTQRSGSAPSGGQ